MKHCCQILYFLFCFAWSYSYGTENIVMPKNSWYYDFYEVPVKNLTKNVMIWSAQVSIIAKMMWSLQ